MSILISNDNFNVLTNIVKYFMYFNLYPAVKMEVLVENVAFVSVRE